MTTFDPAASKSPLSVQQLIARLDEAVSSWPEVIDYGIVVRRDFSVASTVTGEMVHGFRIDHTRKVIIL